MFRTQRSASGGAPLTRTRLARPAGSASNDTATIGFCAEGEKQAARGPIVPWIAEFSESRVSPFGFPLSVPEPPDAAARGTATTGSGSNCAASFCGPARPKPGSRRSTGRSRVASNGLPAPTPAGRGGGFPVPMPKKSHPVLDHVRATIRPSTTGFPAKLCGDLVCILLLYRRIARIA